jgi:hypothetical protein
VNGDSSLETAYPKFLAVNALCFVSANKPA